VATLYVVPRDRQTGNRTDRGSAKSSENPTESGTRPSTAVRMPLVGFVVAKKVAQNACARNRAKRRVREAYRLLRESEQAAALRLNNWYALVWVIHEKALEASWEEIAKTVSESLIQANSRFAQGDKDNRGPNLSRNPRGVQAKPSDK